MITPRKMPLLLLIAADLLNIILIALELRRDHLAPQIFGVHLVFLNLHISLNTMLMCRPRPIFALMLFDVLYLPIFLGEIYSRRSELAGLTGTIYAINAASIAIFCGNFILNAEFIKFHIKRLQIDRF